jgi:LysM repeat protein
MNMRKTFSMSRFLPVALALSLFSVFVPVAVADEAQMVQELRELRQLVQQQSRHIEVLAEQVARLNRLLDVRSANPALAPLPATSPDAPAATAEPVPEAPKAEPVVKAESTAAGPKHVVAKGETLTSIAKQYNISVADLKKANKIENERKMQIGQVLTVPAIKETDAPEKKENP